MSALLSSLLAAVPRPAACRWSAEQLTWLILQSTTGAGGGLLAAQDLQDKLNACDRASEGGRTLGHPLLFPRG